MQKNIVLLLLYLVVFFATSGLAIYTFILFIKLARRGIVALDIYIDKNKK